MSTEPKTSRSILINIVLLVVTVFLASISLAYSQETGVVRSKKIIKLGKGWATNTINTVIFRHHGVITASNFQFASFYDSEGNIKIVRRDLLSNEIMEHLLSGEYNLIDAHNSISMGIDRHGYLHLSFDHHANKLRYRRSKKPLSIDAWTEVIQMTNERESQVTYPTFICDGDRKQKRPLLFLYRDGSSNKGDAYIKEFDEQTTEWKDRSPCILSGSQQKPWTSNAYWNHPVIDHTGRLHLSFVWRTDSPGSERRVNNINVDYAYSDDSGLTWYSSRGCQFKSPITQVNSETVWAVSPGSNLINQASMAVDSKGHPHIVFYSDDPEGIPQYQHLWFDGKSWQHRFISNRNKRFILTGGGALQIPISRPEIVVDKQDRVYVIYRGDFTGDKMSVQRLLVPDYSPDTSELRVLWPEYIEYAEPIIDRVRWSRDGVLTMLIQRNSQPSHDEGGIPRSEPVYLVDWDIVGDWNNLMD
ncbi:MAG: BNR repeat-containing protein [Desulfosalsimonadaceae bacterium]